MAKKNKVVAATNRTMCYSDHNFQLVDFSARNLFAQTAQGGLGFTHAPVLKLFCTKCGEVRPL